MTNREDGKFIIKINNRSTLLLEKDLSNNFQEVIVD
jgi:hypothetical protein